MSEVNKATIMTLLQMRDQARRDLAAFLEKCCEADAPVKVGDVIQCGNKPMAVTRVTLELGRKSRWVEAEKTTYHDEVPQWVYRGKFLRADGSVGLRDGFEVRDYE